MGVPWSAEQLARLLDHVPAGIGVWDAELRCEFLNRAASAGIGSVGDPWGRPLSELVPRSTYDAALARVRRAIGGEQQQFVRTLADSDGREAYFDLAYLPVPGPPGRPNSVVAVGADASAEVAAEVLRRDIAPYLATVSERERVADELEHRLAVHLESLSTELGDLAHGNPDLYSALEQASTLTGAALDQLRASVHNKARVGSSAQLPAAADQVVRDASVALGFAPAFALRGPVERVGPPLADEILAVLQEGLSNVARHARASQIVAAVSATRSEVTVTIADDGAGMVGAEPGSGMANLRARAERFNGVCTWGSAGSAGTIMEWRVPLPGAGRRGVQPLPDTSPLADLPTPSATEPSPPVHLSAERLLAVLDALPIVVGVWDTESRNEFANRACVDWMGRRDRSEVIGRLVSELLPEDVVIGSQPFVRAVLEGVPQQFDRKTVDGRGRSKHIRAVFTPRVVDGQVRGYLGQLFDVTERVRTQEVLRHSVEQMTALEERRRIAEDLHDVVVQHLFAAGLRLDAARSAAGADAAVIDRAVARVDEAIARLRESITSLRSTPAPS